MGDRAKYLSDYRRENYDTITISLPKGYRESIRKLAKAEGLSMAQWIADAIDEHAARQEDAYTRKD